MAITNTFDCSTENITRPSDVTAKIPGFPETVIVTFSERMYNILLENHPVEIVGSMTAGMEIPIYKIEYKGKAIAFYRTWIGGPITTGLIEEILVKGGKKILLFGSCGSLDKDITDGQVVVPEYAYRDEGTSYHYVPAEAGDYIKVKTAGRLLGIMTELNVPAIKGRTWTTDAMYRETRRNAELRKKDGCITVEMECASVMALAEFRNAEIYQFLYIADNLDFKKWESRLLGNMPDDTREKYVRIALEVAARL